MAASPAPTNAATQAVERSCDGRPAVLVDTTVNSQDPLLRSVQPLGRRVPQYPEGMRSAGSSGRVVASFVIDTLGRVPSGGAWIHAETELGFGNAVCAHLASAQFAPLVVNGRRVSVRIQQWEVTFETR
jgi:outer membrane biosynthesis protein TonB